MKLKAVAVTCTKYYLDPSVYCVKVLKIRTTLKEGIRWHVSTIMSIHSTFELGLDSAMHLSQEHDLLFVSDVNHGQHISQEDHAKLSRYGLLDR